MKISISEAIADEIKSKPSNSTSSGLIEEPPTDRFASNPGLANQLERSIAQMLVANDDLKVRRRARRGRISRRRLYKSALPGEVDVFEQKRRLKHDHESASVLICIDCSSSMSVHYRSSLAAICASAIAVAVMRYPKSQSAVLGFGLARGKICGISVIKDWHEKRERMPIIDNGLLTPTAEAIQYAEIMLAAEQSTKKIVFVVTDGIPDSVRKTQLAMIRLIDQGIKVGTCFIGETPENSFPGVTVTVGNVQEMPNKMANLFRKCL